MMYSTAATRLSYLFNQAYTFFSNPASARPLGVARILVSCVLLIQAFLLTPDLYELYGSQGLLQGDLNNALIPFASPCVYWFTLLLAPTGVTTDQIVAALFLCYVGSLASLLIGFKTKVSSILTWIFHFILIFSTGGLSSYGADSYAHIFLFYFMFMPMGEALALDASKSEPKPDTDFNRLALRILQLHLCLSYFVAGVSKGVGPQWITGEAIWRATMMPDFANMNMSWLMHFPWLTKIMAWGTVFFEATYPIFIWSKKTRPIWLTSIILMHVGIFFVMGLKTFALLLIVLNIALFAIPETTEPSSSIRH